MNPKASGALCHADAEASGAPLGAKGILKFHEPKGLGALCRADDEASGAPLGAIGIMKFHESIEDKICEHLMNI